LGNYDAIITAHFSRKILAAIGLNPERLALHWASAAEATLYVGLVTKFTRRIEELGPLGSEKGLRPEDLGKRLAAARAAATDVKLRLALARLTLDLRQEKDYSLETLTARMAAKIDPILDKCLVGGEPGT
jgi:hypothetical protein